MKSETDVLIVVAKQPAPRQTKTRLSPPMSPEQASALYECFLQDTLDKVRRVENVQPAIAYLPADAQDYFRRLAPDFELIQQEGNDLGFRLDNALTFYLSRGFQRAAIMDSDSPTLPAEFLSQAFETLSDGADVVLGPCEDGGYYLIGMKKPSPRLLREVRMSTPNVAQETMALAAEEGLRLGLLPSWYDVDDASSLARLSEEIKNLEPEAARQTRAFLQQNQIWRMLDAES